MAVTRTANAVWRGNLLQGSGNGIVGYQPTYPERSSQLERKNGGPRRADQPGRAACSCARVVLLDVHIEQSGQGRFHGR